MSESSFDADERIALVDYFKDVIFKFLAAPSRSEEYSPDFYSLTKTIQRESEKNIRIISEIAANIFVDELEKKRGDGKEMSDKESGKMIKKSIEKAHKQFTRR
jgi:hypothetical protein